MGSDGTKPTRGVVLGAATVQAKGSLRSSFSAAHIKIAVNAAHQAQTIEATNQSSGHGPWFEEMMMHVPVAVVMSAATVEAAVNEWAQDVLDGATSHEANECQRILIEDLIKSRRDDPPTRFRKLCLYLGQTAAIDDVKTKNIISLAKLRNHLMHFRPEWSNEPVHHSLFQELKGKGVPVYPPYAEPFLLPYSFMTAGCARWAVESALEFLICCSNANGYPDRFTPIKNEWELWTARASEA